MSSDDFETRDFETRLRAAWRDPAAEAALEARHQREVAVLVVGFTEQVARTDAHGVVHALGLSRAAADALEPALRAGGGTIASWRADGVLACFDQPAAALLAALDAQRALAAFNQDRTGHLCRPDRNEPIRASMGLGFGPTLVVAGRDLYGPEVDRASVLAQGVGLGGEVLVTEAVAAALRPPPAGVGTHRAPEPRTQQARFPFHLVGDYRD